MSCYVGSLKHRKSLSSLLKQIAAASFDKLKDEIKAALTDGSKLALAVDAWTGVNHTKSHRLLDHAVAAQGRPFFALIRYDMGSTRETNGRKRIYESWIYESCLAQLIEWCGFLTIK
jgi:hypothetical protein